MDALDQESVRILQNLAHFKQVVHLRLPANQFQKSVPDFATPKSDGYPIRILKGQLPRRFFQASLSHKKIDQYVRIDHDHGSVGKESLAPRVDRRVDFFRRHRPRNTGAPFFHELHRRLRHAPYIRHARVCLELRLGR